MAKFNPEYERQARQAMARTRPEDRPEGIVRLKPHEGHYSTQPKGKA